MNFEELRNVYPEFSYNWYKLDEDDYEYKISYEFEIKNLSKFHPTWCIPKKNNSKFNSENKELIENMVFNLGMAELVSYWKITCSPLVTIKNIYLNDKQIEWWKNYIFMV